jgi:hypothetical protein
MSGVRIDGMSASEALGPRCAEPANVMAVGETSIQYYTVAPEEDGWSDWIVPTDKELNIACCDCGLVHEYHFKVANGEIAFRARRNDPETARFRHSRIKIIKAP